MVRFFTVCADIRSHCTSCALADSECLFFALSQRIGEEKTPRRSPLDPPWFAPKLLTLPRHQCFGGVEQIRILRSHFDTKMRTRKWHAPCDCKFFCQLLRTLVRTNFKQKRESNTLAKRFPVQTTRRDYPAADAKRVPRGNAWAPFFRHFLGRAKKWHKKHKPRARAAGTV